MANSQAFQHKIFIKRLALVQAGTFLSCVPAGIQKAFQFLHDHNLSDTGSFIELFAGNQSDTQIQIPWRINELLKGRELYLGSELVSHVLFIQLPGFLSSLPAVTGLLACLTKVFLCWSSFHAVKFDL